MQRLKNFLRFLKSRVFLLNLGAGTVVLFVCILAFSRMLRCSTRFGAENYVTVPDLRGIPAEQVGKKLEALELTWEITDSVFTDDGEKGTVWLQQPRPTSESKQKVKKGRKIYITVVSKMPKLVTVPKLVSKSRRHAEGILRVIGLKAKIKYKPYDECNDCVIEQLYKGKETEKGLRVARGETITLVLGQKSNERQTVIDLMGQTIEGARARLSETSFIMNIGKCEGCLNARDSANAVINSQIPMAGAEIAAGSTITVYLKAQ